LLLAILTGCIIASSTVFAASAKRDRDWDACNGSDSDAAIVGCTNVINRGKRETQSNRATAYNNRGWSYSEKDDHDRAIADYDEAIRLDPNNALAFVNRGWSYERKGEYDRAIADYDDAIEADPKYSLAYNNRGWIRYLQGDPDRAIADYTAAIRLDPKDPTAYINRCDAYNRKGEPDRAIPDCEAVIRLDPKGASGGYNGRADAYFRKGQYDRAIQDYDKAIKIDPDFGRAHANRGLAYEKKGDFARARADFKAAAAIPPENKFEQEAYDLARDRLAAPGDQATRQWQPAPAPASPVPHAADASAAAPADAPKASVAPPPAAAQPAPAPASPAPHAPDAIASAPVDAPKASAAPPPAAAQPAPAPASPAPHAPDAIASAPVDAPKASAAPPPATAQPAQGNRVALVIGNAAYPDDGQLLPQPIKDAQAMAEELRHAGFEVIAGDDVNKQRLAALLNRFKAKIQKGSTALIFFSGYGIQSGRQSYLLPIDARIWTESDVKHDGITIESILEDMDSAGAAVKLVIIDAARRSPFERRFRGTSTGLAPIVPSAGTLAIFSAAPDKLIDHTDKPNSIFVTELLKKMRTPGLSAEAIFNSAKNDVAHASQNEQLPWVSSSLADDFYFTNPAAADSASPPAAPAPAPSTPAPPPASTSQR
jgi:tetratricopeptide (TPR) repeat protein